MRRDHLTEHIDHQDPTGDRDKTARLVELFSGEEPNQHDELPPGSTPQSYPHTTENSTTTHLCLATISCPTIRNPGFLTPRIERSSPSPASSDGVALTTKTRFLCASYSFNKCVTICVRSTKYMFSFVFSARIDGGCQKRPHPSHSQAFGHNDKIIFFRARNLLENLFMIGQDGTMSSVFGRT